MLRAVVTTNFDRLIERALEAAGVPHRVFVTTGDFASLPAALDGAGGCLLIKVHGSVENLDSMVDTLAQRVAGRPRCSRTRSRSCWNAMPASRWDFRARTSPTTPTILGLRSAVEHAVELTVLNRRGDAPLDAMVRLVAAYGRHAHFLDGDLPSALGVVSAALEIEPPRVTSATTGTPSPEAHLIEHTKAWADERGTVTALNMFTSLVDTNERDATMLRFLMFFKRYYRTTEGGHDPAYWRFEQNFGHRLHEEGLLGQIEPEDAGLTVPGIHDSDARDYADARQFLSRAGSAKIGNLLEGRIELTRALALAHGPGRVLGNVEQILDNSAGVHPTGSALMPICSPPSVSSLSAEAGRPRRTRLNARRQWGTTRAGAASSRGPRALWACTARARPRGCSARRPWRSASD